jgi:hypothetical protein
MSGENAKIEKIKKSSRIAFIVTNITKIVAIVGAVACILGGGAIYKFRDLINEVLASEITNEAIREKDVRSLERFVGITVAESGQAAQALAWEVITGSVILICMAVVLHFVAKIFKDIQESYTPFQPGIIRNLKIPLVLITVMELKSSLLIGLLIGLTSWCVVSIFEYGCELQRQSDETL